MSVCEPNAIIRRSIYQLADISVVLVHLLNIAVNNFQSNEFIIG